ncbi:MAG TPA: TetR/AcrR family transcriptional regulator [Polyangiales bacterium]|nr:TetR/AcrR family transcriptional regulator [Polyangiales bacterium]
MHGRSARVLEAVLDAALEELGRVGYGAFRIEDVAARSGVNKTTIYRRWPTKVELVAAVLTHAKEPPSSFDTGTLEGDVRASLFEMRDRLRDTRHGAVVRIVMAERAQPEVNEIVTQLRERYGSVRRKIFDRAIERGDLSPGTDTRALVEFMSAPLVTRMVHQGATVEDDYLEVLTRFVCAGARSFGSHA